MLHHLQQSLEAVRPPDLTQQAERPQRLAPAPGGRGEGQRRRAAQYAGAVPEGSRALFCPGTSGPLSRTDGRLAAHVPSAQVSGQHAPRSRSLCAPLRPACGNHGHLGPVGVHPGVQQGRRGPAPRLPHPRPYRSPARRGRRPGVSRHSAQRADGRSRQARLEPPQRPVHDRGPGPDRNRLEKTQGTQADRAGNARLPGQLGAGADARRHAGQSHRGVSIWRHLVCAHGPQRLVAVLLALARPADGDRLLSPAHRFCAAVTLVGHSHRAGKTPGNAPLQRVEKAWCQVPLDVVEVMHKERRQVDELLGQVNEVAAWVDRTEQKSSIQELYGKDEG